LIKELEALVTSGSRSRQPVIPTWSVYIFDPCTSQEMNRDSYKVGHSLTTSNVPPLNNRLPSGGLCCPNVDALRAFGYEDLAMTLNGKLVNHLENMLTLDLSFAAEFEHFNVWFVATVCPIS